jgi:flagellar biosynthesis protein FliR
MNLFSVGMPATILAGVILLAVAAPAIGDGITASIERGLDLSRQLASGKP